MTDVILYGRAGCHLCEDALAVVQRLRSRRVFSLREVDIEQDEDLLRRYLERIPVLAVDGEELFELFVDEGELDRQLAIRAAAGAPLVE
jgi:glutaredoxin